MTVSSAQNFTLNVGNGISQNFGFGFRILAATHLTVYLNRVLQSSGYTVDGVGAAGGGNVTFAFAPGLGVEILLQRAVPLSRQTDYVDNGDFTAQDIDDDQDLQTMQIQDAGTDNDRTIKVPIGETLADLPAAAARVGKAIAFDAAGAVTLATISGASDPSLRADLASTASGKGTSLIGHIASGTGAVARTVQGKLRDVVSVFDFMTAAQIADVQAGTALVDVTAAIQAAIGAVTAAGGGTVYLPEGSYKVTSSLTADGSKDIWLKGDGWSSIITTSTASCIPIDFGDSTQDRTADIRVTDLRVTGAAGTSHGIRFKRLHSARVENVRVNNMGGNGIELDRCYATWFDRVYSNNNTGSGFHSGLFSAAIGNDFMVFIDCRALANGTKGFHLDESAHGTVFERCDIEGNAVGIQVDGGANATDAIHILRCYFESQTGKNVSLAEDVGAARVDCVNFIGNTVNPGTVSAAVNSCAFDDVRVLRVQGNHFSTSNFTITDNTRQLQVGPNKYSSATGPFAATEPVSFIRDAAGAILNNGFQAIGWNTRHRIGIPYSGDKTVAAMNLLMTADAAGTQDDATVGSSALMLGPNQGRLVRCAAGGGAALSVPFRFDVDGFTVASLKVDVVATASLPAAGSTQDGRILIEDNGTGDRNLILYAGGQRFRIDGGAAF